MCFHCVEPRGRLAELGLLPHGGNTVDDSWKQSPPSDQRAARAASLAMRELPHELLVRIFAYVESGHGAHGDSDEHGTGSAGAGAGQA